jgi:Fur family transcriptional regulator, iron response regulator
MTMTHDITVEALRDRLRAAGLRPTRQREELAGLLFGSGDRHVTAEALHREAMLAGTQVSLATVYNTLHQFTQAGLLREVVVDSGRAYFDTNISRHHHFFNTHTHELADIHGDAIAVGRLPDAPEGTRIEDVEVVVRVTPARG